MFFNVCKYTRGSTYQQSQKTVKICKIDKDYYNTYKERLSSRSVNADTIKVHVLHAANNRHCARMVGHLMQTFHFPALLPERMLYMIGAQGTEQLEFYGLDSFTTTYSYFFKLYIYWDNTTRPVCV